MTTSKAVTLPAHQPKSGPVEHAHVPRAQLERNFASTLGVILANVESTVPLKVQFEDPKSAPVVLGKAACLTQDQNAEGVTGGTEGASDTFANKPEKVARPLQIYKGKTLCENTLDLVRAAALTRVVVVISPGATAAQVAQIVQAKVDSWQRAGEVHPAIEVVEVSPDEIEAARQAKANFSVMDIPHAVLQVASSRLGSTFERALFLSVDQVRITPWHLNELALRAQAHPTFDMVTSWIQWLRRTPLLISAGAFAKFEAACAAQAKTLPVGHILQLDVEEVVFGEEKLAANAATPAAVEKFANENKLSALEAVNLARAEAAACTKQASEQVQRQIKQLAQADKLLFDLAKQVVQSQGAALEANTDLAADVAWANAWGQRQRADFPIFDTAPHKNKLTYMDTAATSQRLTQALSAEFNFNTHENANIYRGAYALSAGATAAYNNARTALEHFVGAGKRELIFTRNTTDSLNIVATCWGARNIKKGDTVLVALSEHHSNLVPWQKVCNQAGAHLEYIPICPDGTLDMAAFCAQLEQASRVAAVCVAQVSNVLGMLNPVAEIARAAHAAGARVIVDAAQSAPHMPLDVAALGADFVAFSGHKLYGPMGVGCLYISPEVFDQCDPVYIGGGTISHVSKNTYYLRQRAVQYEPGTPPVAQAVGLAAAVRHLELIDMKDAARHNAALTKYLMAGLERLGCVTVWGNHNAPAGQVGLVSMTMPGVPASQVGAVMAQVGVAVRAGGHCALPLSAAMGQTGTVRVSLGLHTTQADIDATLCALKLAWHLHTTSN
jgi:cysteine desulfurase/selenocysteine lyase